MLHTVQEISQFYARAWGIVESHQNARDEIGIMFSHVAKKGAEGPILEVSLIHTGEEFEQVVINVSHKGGKVIVSIKKFDTKGHWEPVDYYGTDL